MFNRRFAPPGLQPGAPRRRPPGPAPAIVLALLCGSPPALSQTLPSAQAVYAAIVARYGGTSVESATNGRITGTLSWPDGRTAGYTLTIQKRRVRLDYSRGGRTWSQVRNDKQIQESVDGKAGFADFDSVAASPVNLAPIFALLNFGTDARFTASVVPGNQGLVGLRFLERNPPGVRPPPFEQPKLIATFWVDSQSVIQGLSYAWDNNPSWVLNYQYFYATTVPGSFLQPAQVDQMEGTRLLRRASAAAATTGVAIPAGYFQIAARQP